MCLMRITRMLSAIITKTIPVHINKIQGSLSPGLVNSMSCYIIKKKGVFSSFPTSTLRSQNSGIPGIRSRQNGQQRLIFLRAKGNFWSFPRFFLLPHWPELVPVPTLKQVASWRMWLLWFTQLIHLDVSSCLFIARGFFKGAFLL